MSQLRVGVIGTGMMGCEHLRNLIGIPEVTITAISDIHEQQREWAQHTLKDSVSPVATFADHQDLLNSGLIDAVLVATPNFTHKALLDDIFETDIPVMVEKPMCTTVADCISIVHAQEKRSAITWVGLEYRYMAPVAGLLRQLHNGAVGNLKMMSIREHRFPFLVKVDNWNRFSQNTGGTLVEKCCHFFDLMNLAVGSRPVRVLASGGQDVNHLDEIYDAGPSDIPTEREPCLICRCSQKVGNMNKKSRSSGIPEKSKPSFPETAKFFSAKGPHVLSTKLKFLSTLM